MNRAIQLLEDPAVTGPLLHLALTLDALGEADVSLNWLGSHLWPIGGAHLVWGLVDNDMSGDRVLPRYFPEYQWLRYWRSMPEMAGRPVLSVIQGGAA